MSPPPAPLLPAAVLPRRAARNRSVLRGLLLTALLVLAGLPVSAHAEQSRWQWPLPPPHRVVAPFEAPEHRYGAGHRGIDIAARAEGAEVRAVEAGTVRFSGMVAGRGVVSVRHSDGLISTYEPVHGALEAGSPVAAGEVLGTIEHRPELSHCPGQVCLHLGARRGKEYLDPMLLLGARGPSVLLPWGGAAVDAAPRSRAHSGARPAPGASGVIEVQSAPGASPTTSAPDTWPRVHGAGPAPPLALVD